MSETKGVPNTLAIQNITPRLLSSTLKLFNAIPISDGRKQKPSKRLTELTLDHGFVFSPSVIANYKESELISLIGSIEKEVGLSPAQMNKSFHKSWKKVRDAPIYQLFMEQIFHYFTTYGYERLGVYDENLIYIPNETLNLPDIEGDIKLSVVKGYTESQLKTKLSTMLESGIALNNIDEIVEVSKFCKLRGKDISSIKNKEVRIRLYKNLDIIPEEPIEFLRLVLLETGNDLLIINKQTIEKIKESTSDVTDLFRRYDEEFGYKRLAEIFLRFKPLFLAFKNDETREIINKISNLAPKYHKPLTPSLLNDITGKLKNHKGPNMTQFREELNNANIFRKIRLLHALHYRTLGNPNILYKVRNGKSYAKELSFDNIEGAKKVSELVLKSIIGDLKHLKGKKVYIPNNIKYSLPATTKQFTGNIPSGSYVTVPKDIMFGVNWYDVGRHRIDLDLSVISIENGKIGWNAKYRTDNILFSGDVTAAPDGASELFYINKDYDDTLMMYVNYFNHDKDIKVPFKIVVAEEHPNTFGRNYMINPNNIQCIAKTDINTQQKILGLVRVTGGECRFYFSETGLGNSIASSSGKHNDMAREYFVDYLTNMITFNDVLEMVGAKLVNEPTKDVINLSPETIEKDTFIKLLTK